MNKHKFLVAAIIFAGAIPVQAQEQNKILNLASPKEIAPPDYALSRIPKGGKSRYYGAAFFGTPLNEEVRVHFYQWPKNNPAPNDSAENPLNDNKNGRLDVFVRKQKKGAQFHLVQKLDMDNSTLAKFDNVFFTANYLVPNKPYIPMMTLKTVLLGESATFTRNAVMVFSTGWSQKPYVKVWLSGASRFEGTSSGISTSLDSRGVVQILQQTFAAEAGLIETQYWPWNGETFVHTETETYNIEGKSLGRKTASDSDEEK